MFLVTIMSGQNFVCECCDYITNHRGRFNRHNNTESHRINVGGIKVIKSDFTCELCDYTTIHKSNYDRHVTSKKHRANQDYTCDICGIEYKTESGLVKHGKTCCSKNNIVGNNK